MTWVVKAVWAHGESSRGRRGEIFAGRILREAGGSSVRGVSAKLEGDALRVRRDEGGSCGVSLAPGFSRVFVRREISAASAASRTVWSKPLKRFVERAFAFTRLQPGANEKSIRAGVPKRRAGGLQPPRCARRCETISSASCVPRRRLQAADTERRVCSRRFFCEVM